MLSKLTLNQNLNTRLTIIRKVAMVKERCSIRLYFMIVFFACFLQESHQAPVVINHHFLKTMMPQMRSPLEIRNRHLIQMISDQKKEGNEYFDESTLFDRE